MRIDYVDSKWSRKKLGKKAGVAYGVGMRIHKPELAWVAGPFPAGSHTDVIMFRKELKGKLESLNALLPVKKKVCYLHINKLYSNEKSSHITYTLLIIIRLLLIESTTRNQTFLVRQTTLTAQK